jgi:hypothetical protein
MIDHTRDEIHQNQATFQTILCTGLLSNLACFRKIKDFELSSFWNTKIVCGFRIFPPFGSNLNRKKCKK